MGLSWIRYFAIMLVFAGLGFAILGFQYHAALVDHLPKAKERPKPSAIDELADQLREEGEAMSPKPDVKRPSFVQSIWALLFPKAKLSDAQVGIVSSGALTVFVGLLLLVIGPMIVRRVIDHLDLE